MLYPGLLHPEPLPLQQSTAHQTQFWLSPCGSLWGLCVLVHTRYVWALWAPLAGMGCDSKRDFAPPTSCWGFSFALGHEVSLQSGSSAYHLTGASLSLDMTEGKFSSLSLLRVDEDQINQTTAKGWAQEFVNSSKLLTLHDLPYTLQFPVVTLFGSPARENKS